MNDCAIDESPSQVNDLSGNDQPLGVLFERARCVATGSQPSTNEDKHAAVQTLDHCSALVHRMGLFSTNEEIDDVSTINLKYMLISSYMANLISDFTFHDQFARSRDIERAYEECSRFLSLCSNYGLVDKDLRAVATSTEEGAERLDPVTLRAAKIARFKTEKELSVSILKLQQKRLQRMRLQEMLSDDDADDMPAEDEEVERDFWLLTIRMAVVKCVDLMASLRSIVEHQELDLLQRMLSLPEKERKGIEGSSKKAGPPPELMSTLVAAARNLERHAASGLTGSRTQDAHGILRPSHNLPTISLAEQAAYEMKLAAKAGSNASNKGDSGENSDPDDEDARQKAIHWDEFKDDNPRGWGNRKGQG